MNKRSGSELVDRDESELQRSRLNPRHTQSRSSTRRSSRRSPDFSESYASGSLQSMEFEIQQDMVGAVIGKGGTTARAIRSRTGANVHVHSPTTESPRTYVELRGRRDQIEAAFEELRTVVSSVDEEFAKQMQASVTLKTKPETVGCLIGKQGQNIKQIEEETRARVRVEAHEEGEEYQCVHVSGDVASVEYATRLVQESLERYDATRLKKQFPVPMTSHRAQAVASVKAIETKPMVLDTLPKREADVAAPSIVIQAPAGGFGSHPAVLVLQADGTYHPAQIVTAYDGGMSNPGLVTVVAQPGSLPGIVSQSQTTAIDSTGQRVSTVFPTALPQGTPQAIYQPPIAAGGSGLISQITTPIPMTQATQIPQLSLTGGSQQQSTLTSDNYIQQQQQQPQQSMQVYDFTMTRGASQAFPDLTTLSSIPTIGGGGGAVSATLGFDLRQPIPVSLAINPQSSNLPSAT